MHSCENLVRRKSQINKLVRCSQRDPRSGIVDHFVVNKGRTKGCWISSEHIDLSALVLELHTRRQKHTDKRMHRIRAEKQGEKERKAEQAAEAQRRAVEQLREKMRLEAIRQKQKAEQESAARLANQKTQASNPMHGSMQLEMTKHNQDFKLTLMQHENDIRQLMQACILSRVLPVPEGQIVAIRNRNLARLKAAVEGLRRCNVPLSIDHEQLTNVLVAREKGAAESILNLKKGLRANNMPTASSQNTSSTSAPLGGFSSQPFTQSLSTHSYQSQGQNTGPQNSSAVLGSFNSFSSTPTHHVTSFSHGRNGK